MSLINSFIAASRPTPFGRTPRLDGLEPQRDTSYDAKWAYALSVLSGWAYSEGRDFTDQLPYYGFPDATVQQLAVANPAMFVVATAYFVQSKDGRAGVLAFRGTEPTSLMNWLTDAETSKYRFGRGYVHSGFLANVEALWGDVVREVNRAIENKLEALYITGHSLGGAMAVLAAARIFRNGDREWQRRLRGVYTFGQPMVGDEAFNAEFGELGKLLYRHIYDDDVVPCLPPTSVDASFKHFGVRRIAASQEATWTVSTDDDRRADLLGIGQILESFITRRIDALNWLHVPYSLDDHSPRGYIEVSRNSLDGSTTGDVVKLGNGAPRARSILDLLARATSRLPFEVAIRRVGVGYHSRRNGKEHG